MPANKPPVVFKKGCLCSIIPANVETAKRCFPQSGSTHGPCLSVTTVETVSAMGKKNLSYDINEASPTSLFRHLTQLVLILHLWSFTLSAEYFMLIIPVWVVYLRYKAYHVLLLPASALFSLAPPSTQLPLGLEGLSPFPHFMTFENISREKSRGCTRYFCCLSLWPTGSGKSSHNLFYLSIFKIITYSIV